MIKIGARRYSIAIPTEAMAMKSIQLEYGVIDARNILKIGRFNKESRMMNGVNQHDNTMHEVQERY